MNFDMNLGSANLKPEEIYIYMTVIVYFIMQSPLDELGIANLKYIPKITKFQPLL